MAAEERKSGESFLSRWSRRKVEVARGVDAAVPVSEPGVTISDSSIGAASGAKMPEEARPERTLSPAAVTPPLPLPPVESLDGESDFAPFMRAEVAPALRNQAMKKLFSDPHYNVMDRLDIYIDDYGKPDPIPPAMLRMMNQSKALGLFEEEERAEEAARRAASGEEPAAETPAAETEAADVAADAPTANIPQAFGDEVAPAADNATFPFAPISSDIK
ncbi:MAG TPA: DUF3306 domain-containing protein [Usitatibacteraceae bacterium]